MSTGRTQLNCRRDTALTFGLSVPPPTATEGPAVGFFYRSNDFTGDATMSIRHASTFTATDLDPSVAWSEHVYCLPPSLGGRWTQMHINILRQDFACGDDIILTSFFDDFSVGTDSSCPTE